jgi:predicted anti-sigma-YlaC factor YlaD
MSRLKNCWHFLNLPCEAVSRLASESLDRELTRIERISLRSHLIYCSACRRYFRQIELLTIAARSWAARLETDLPAAGPRLPDDIREAIKRSLRQN